MSVEGMPKGPRKETPPIPPIRRPKAAAEAPKQTFAEQLAVQQTKLKANEAVRTTLDQAPYDEATLEGDMETAGDFRPAAKEEGDVPSWDAADLKESVMGGMGMAPELDTDQHRFGDPRALNMAQAADLPASKKKETWKSKAGNIEIDLEAMGVSAADIYELPPDAQVKALKTELDPSGIAERVPALSRLEEDMPEQQLEAIANAFGAGFGPEGTQAATEAVQEIEAMPKAKKERTLNGITNLGVFISEWKSDMMAGVIGAAARKTDDGSFMNRLLRSGKEYYERKSASSRKLIENETKLASLAGATSRLSKVGSILSWGRVGLDIVGKGAFAKHLNPFRHMTAGAMAIGAGAEVIKETRFKANALKEKTRVQDVDEAETEARALYEETAKKSGGKVTAEALSAVYQERLPKDLLARLENNFMAGSSFVGKVLQKDLAWGVERIQGKLDKIDGNKKLNDAQKAQKRQELLASYNGFLREADLMTTRAAGVDAASYGARLVEKSAKAFVTVMAVDTIARLFMSAHDLLDRNFGSGTAVGAAAAKGVEQSFAPKALETLPQTDAEVMTAESRELPPGIASMETIGAGGSITGSLMKQLEDHPEKFGYTGDTGRSSEQLHAWAFKTAKSMAKQAGFLTRKDQQDTWLSHAAVGRLHIGVDMSHGKPELAMVDEKNHVISAAELKAGPYGMNVPFADKGQEAPAPETLTPEQRPAPAADYYLKKAFGSAEAALDPNAKKSIGLLLVRMKGFEMRMRDMSLSETEREGAKKMATALYQEANATYGKTLPKGWMDRVRAAEVYSSFVQHGDPRIPTAPPDTLTVVEETNKKGWSRGLQKALDQATARDLETMHKADAALAKTVVSREEFEHLTAAQQADVGQYLRMQRDYLASLAPGRPADPIALGEARETAAMLKRDYGVTLPKAWMPPEPLKEAEHAPPVETRTRRVVRKNEPPSPVESEWEADRRAFMVENLKRAQAILGGKALEGLSQEQRVEVGKLLRTVDSRHQELHASVADGVLSVGDEIKYGEPYRQAVAELEEKYGKVLPEKWLGKLTRYAHPESTVTDHEHGAKEETAPTPPPVKPLRRPVRAQEPEPVPVPKTPEVEVPLVLKGVEHPEWAQEFKGILTKDFNILSVVEDDYQSKNVLLTVLHRLHEAKDMLAKAPVGSAEHAELSELIEQGKDVIESGTMRAALKPDWFQKV